MPYAKNERSVTGRIADFLLQHLTAVYLVHAQSFCLKKMNFYSFPVVVFKIIIIL